MLQCLISTLPFAYFYLNTNPDILKIFINLKETFANYALDTKGLKMQMFIKEYYTKPTVPTAVNQDPSVVFEMICAQKKYFGNYSEQDCLDALLTLLDVLIDSQKEVYKQKIGSAEKNLMISNFCVPIGSIFTFHLSSKSIFLLFI